LLFPFWAQRAASREQGLALEMQIQAGQLPALGSAAHFPAIFLLNPATDGTPLLPFSSSQLRQLLFPGTRGHPDLG